jgi:hypothetical protein
MKELVVVAVVAVVAVVLVLVVVYLNQISDGLTFQQKKRQMM